MPSAILLPDSVVQLPWRQPIDALAEWAAQASAKTAEAADVIQAADGREGFHGVVYNPQTDELAAVLDKTASPALRASCDLICRPADDIKHGCWILVARPEPYEGLEKAAWSQLANHALQLLGYAPGTWYAPGNSPGPIFASALSGLVGAGLGYGGGKLLSNLLPESWDRRKLPRTGMILGGLLGAAPGLAAMSANHSAGRGWNDPTLFNEPNLMPGEKVDVPAPAAPAAPPRMKLDPEMLHMAGGKVPSLIKAALDEHNDPTGLFFTPPAPIPIDILHQTVWDDPRVANRLSPPLQSATSALAESAWLLRKNETGQDTRLIWPRDIARISAGMGSGYLSGAVVGKALGVLMGMPEPAQDKLKQTGMWAGVLANLVPIAFEGR